MIKLQKMLGRLIGVGIGIGIGVGVGCFLGETFAMAAPLKIWHYNIKELDSLKISTQRPERQWQGLQYVREHLPLQEVDLFSINEIQYDLPGVPWKNLSTRGENAAMLAQKIFPFAFAASPWWMSFHPANTGVHARKKSNGDYYRDSRNPQARLAADPVNFGLFPSQYSTALLSRYKILEEKVIADLPWKEFNPQLDLSTYRDNAGKTLPPNMELFDKNFTDVVIEYAQRPLHVILLHTVPSFGFGNSASPNFVRNRDQLRFLEWYLTGNTDIAVDVEKLQTRGIRPLPEAAAFVAMGDWNADFANENNPGTMVLKRLLQKVSSWSKLQAGMYTFEDPAFHPQEKKLLLDYMVYRGLKLKRGGIYRPDPQRRSQQCTPAVAEEETATLEIEEENSVIVQNGEFIQISYGQRPAGSVRLKCTEWVHQDYYWAKMASDHFPIWGEFDWE